MKESAVQDTIWYVYLMLIASYRKMLFLRRSRISKMMKWLLSVDAYLSKEKTPVSWKRFSFANI